MQFDSIAVRKNDTVMLEFLVLLIVMDGLWERLTQCFASGVVVSNTYPYIRIAPTAQVGFGIEVGQPESLEQHRFDASLTQCFHGSIDTRQPDGLLLHLIETHLLHVCSQRLVRRLTGRQTQRCIVHQRLDTMDTRLTHQLLPVGCRRQCPTPAVKGVTEQG